MRFQCLIHHTLLTLLFVVLSLQMMASVADAGTVGLPTAFAQKSGFTSISLDYERLSPELKSGQSDFRGNSREERILLSAGYAPSRFLEFHLKFGLAAHETSSRKFNGSLGPAYGFGAKWSVYQKDSLTVGMGFSVLEFITEDDASVTSKLKWDEVEAFIGAALGGFEQMTPYLGLLFSKGRGTFSNGPTVSQKGYSDIFVGAVFRVTDGIDFLSEARLIRENGLTFALSLQL